MLRALRYKHGIFGFYSGCDELCDCKQAGNNPDSQDQELLDQTVDARQIIHPDPVQSYATRQPNQRVRW